MTTLRLQPKKKQMEGVERVLGKDVLVHRFLHWICTHRENVRGQGSMTAKVSASPSSSRRFVSRNRIQ